MKILVILLLTIIIVGGLVGFYYYYEEYLPAKNRYESLLNENKTLSEYLSELREKSNEVLTDTLIDDSIINNLSVGKMNKIYEKNITGIRITLPVGNLFNPGDYKLNKKGRALIKKTAEILSRIKNTEIIVEGHTDNEDIGPSLKKKIPTNWELSALRAIEVVKFLQDSIKIEPSRLSAIAYGETRPIMSNSTKEGREKNRRIEIFLKYVNTNTINKKTVKDTTNTMIEDSVKNE